MMSSTSGDILCFFSRSKDSVPGYGKNESVKNCLDYSELIDTPHWRRVLSNFHVAEFEYNGYHWNTVEHAFQASKVGLIDKDLAYNFTRESASSLGLGDGLEARKHRKVVILPRDKLLEWNSIKSEIMKKILLAKFTQVDLARRVLLATGSAELWHNPPRAKVVRFMELEAVRSELS